VSDVFNAALEPAVTRDHDAGPDQTVVSETAV